MGQNIVVTAMVLNAMPAGEYDKRVTLLTKERGKITAFARGARRQNSPLIAAVNPFSFGEFELYEGRSTYVVSKASVSNYFRELSKDFSCACYGFYFLEMADYYCQENNDEKEMLKLLYQSLRALESPVFSNQLVRVIFELKVFAVNGEAPNLFCCARCKTKEKLRWFSPASANILCKKCAAEVSREQAFRSYEKLEESAVYAMQYILSAKVEKLYTFSVSEKILAQLQHVLHQYSVYHCGYSFKSLKILDEVENTD